MIIGIEHIGITSSDTLRLKDWYAEMFGGKVVYDNGKGTYFLAFSDKSMIEFVSGNEKRTADSQKTEGIRHIALVVSDEEFLPTVEKIKSDSRVETVTDVNVSKNGIKTYWFRDIDGNFVHLIVRPEPLI